MDEKKKAELFDSIRGLMGYNQNGSGTTVTLFQDDATDDYFVKVGDKAHFGYSLAEAIEKAVRNQPKEG